MSWHTWNRAKLPFRRALKASSFMALVLSVLLILAHPGSGQAAEEKTEVVENGPFKITITYKEDDFDYAPSVAVAFSGAPIAMVRLDGAIDKPQVITAELDAGNAFPELVVTGYSGGAHCCTLIKVIAAASDKDGTAWKVVDLGEFDGTVEDPQDLDGDGQAEFLLKDDRFLYAYGCYACSYAPPLILSVRNGKKADLTGNASMRPLLVKEARRLEKMFRKARKRREKIENGVLAGYVALKLRIGEGTDGWRRMLALHQRRERYDFCPVPGEDPYGDCPVRGYRLSFPLHLSIFLRETGYIPGRK